MIVAMAGLPGTGKSTLASVLAEKLPAIILNKDTLRASLFPPDEIRYSNAQNDLVMSIAMQIADYYIREDPSRNIILDGRTFSDKTQVDALVNFSKGHHWDLRFIYCTCSEETAKSRIESDAAKNEHVAANRDYNLYRSLKDQSDPLHIPHLHIDTENPIEVCTSQCLDYLNH